MKQSCYTSDGEMYNKMLRLALVLLLLVCVRCDTIDTLVAEEKNCTKGERSIEDIQYCREYAMQRLTLYIAAQQLYIARHREEREEMRYMKIKNEELKKEKEQIDNKEASHYVFCGLFVLLFAYVSFICLSDSIPPA